MSPPAPVAAGTGPIVVQKYGGSSLANAARLRRVARAVVARRREGVRLVIVVSAMGRTTDRLVAQARALTPAPPLRELDMLVTAGERVAMALLSMAIAAAGAPAISFTGSQSGIITEPRHQGARIVAVRPERIAAALAAGQVVICAGYQGVSAAREVTTLGRGGSDTTAVALAAALGAEACEIYSDVDGVYTADPRVCAQARHLSGISFAAMEAMAQAGARVLHPEAVAFAARAGIALHARQAGARGGGRQTVVGAAPGAAAPVAAVVGAAALVLFAAAPTDLPAGLWPALEALGARVRLGAPGATLLDCGGVPGRDVGRALAAAAALGVTGTAVAAASVVEGAAGSAALGRGGAALAASGVVPLATLMAPRTVTFVVPPAAEARAVRALHAALVAPADGGPPARPT